VAAAYNQAMGYKTILVHVDEAPHSAARVLLAAELALQEGAHVIGVATTGISRFLYHRETIDSDDPNLALHLDVLRARARRALSEFAPRLQSLGVTSLEERVLDDEAGAGLNQLARTADLLIVGQNDPQRHAGDTVAEVLSGAGRPVLILPLAARTSSAINVSADGTASPGAPAPARHVLVAWNASKEAARALLDAMPLLRRADSVDLAIFDDGQMAGHGEQVGNDVLVWLARHGVRAQLLVQPSAPQGLLKRPATVAEGLLAMASERGSDLLVMGAYGHSRFRETLLGGVTRSMLEMMTVPLLMAH
jgi:nucleotide-binding universal stress UspA family protein